MSDLTAIKRIRGVYKASMTKLVAYAKSIDASITIDDMRVKLKRTQELMDLFIEAEKQMFACDNTEESDMNEFEDNYYMILTELNSHIRKRSGSTSGANPGLNASINNAHAFAAEVKLPKLSIPSFSGNYMEWQSFHDLYVSTIHEKENLTPAQKFQYLKSLVTGETASLIRHFNVTEPNYIETFQKLCHRYDRKRHTIYKCIYKDFH